MKKICILVTGWDADVINSRYIKEGHKKSLRKIVLGQFRLEEFLILIAHINRDYIF